MTAKMPERELFQMKDPKQTFQFRPWPPFIKILDPRLQLKSLSALNDTSQTGHGIVKNSNFDSEQSSPNFLAAGRF